MKASRVFCILIGYFTILARSDVFFNSTNNSYNGKSIIYSDFDDYKRALNKTYRRPFEEIAAKRCFDQNIELINAHNKQYTSGVISYRLRANRFADISNFDYLRNFVRLEKSLNRKLFDQSHEQPLVGSITVPDSLDWRDHGFNTPPQNQLTCGACYAFSISHSIEGQIFKRIGQLVTLSVQQIIDCSAIDGNRGCIGGSLRTTLKYLQRSGGLMRDKDYPYTATQNTCSSIAELCIVNITDWAILPQGDEEALKYAIATVGPIAVSINASPKTFQLYSDGIYDDYEICNSNTVNHAMLAIGYNANVFILKNWWGSRWGEDGYMRIRRGKNLCGIANYAAYAIV